MDIFDRIAPDTSSAPTATPAPRDIFDAVEEQDRAAAPPIPQAAPQPIGSDPSVGPARNFLNSTLQNIGQFVSGGIAGDLSQGIPVQVAEMAGAWTPQQRHQYAQQFQQNVAAAYPTNPNNPLYSGTGGEVAGNIVSQVLPMALGVPPGAMAAVGAASTEGQSRLDVMDRRANGEQISQGQEEGAAALNALAEYVGEKMGLEAIGNAVFKASLKQGMKAAAIEYIKAAGVNATEEGATQVMQNLANRAMLEQQRPVEQRTPWYEGAGHSALVGGLVGGVATGVGHAMHGGLHQEVQPPPIPGQQLALPAPAPTAPQDNGGIREAVDQFDPGVPSVGMAPALPPPVPVAVPSAGVQPAPGDVAAPQHAAAVPSPVPASLNQTPKIRVNEGKESRAVSLQFESDIDKALFVATQPRKGKLQADAHAYLESVGYIDADMVESLGDELRDRVESIARKSQGVAVIPAFQRRQNVGQAAPVAHAVANVPGRPAEAAGGVAVAPAQQPQTTSAVQAGVVEGQPANAAGPELTSNPANVALTQQVMADTHEEIAGGPTLQPGERQGKLFLPDDQVESFLTAEFQGTARQVLDTRGLSADDHEVLGLGEQLTGSRPVVYTGGRGRGFFHQGRMFYNPQQNATPTLKREAVSHEAGHWLWDNHPHLALEVYNAIPESIRQQDIAEYERDYRAQEGKNLDPAKRADETTAISIGRSMMRPRIARQVMQTNRSAFVRAVDAVLNKLRSLTARGRIANQVMATLQQARALAQQNGGADGASAAVSEARRPGSAVDRVAPAVNAGRDSAVASSEGGVPRATDSVVPGFRGKVVAVVDDGPSFLPNKQVREQADRYVQSVGLPALRPQKYVAVNVERAKRIAEWFDKTPSAPHDPKVLASYEAMKRETKAQYEALVKDGVKFEPWTQPGQPYENSEAVHKDVRDNRHLWFFPSDSGFGSEGTDAGTHPLMEKAGVTLNGKELVYNDLFRAVHDYYGHAKEGVGFGPRGEENAWLSHSQMYSEEARPAMTAETRGQNSWVNYGPHGEANRANPKNTVYAEQKVLAAPAEFVKPDADAFEGRTFPKYPADEVGYLRPLRTFTDTVYSERGIESAIEILETTGPNNVELGREFYSASDPELALGQGKNTGILFSFDTENLQGKVNKAKPGWSFLYDQGWAEFIHRHNDDATYRNAVKEFTIKPGARQINTQERTTRLWWKRFDNVIVPDLKAKGWVRTEGPNGETWTRPPAPKDQPTFLPSKKPKDKKEAEALKKLRKYLTPEEFSQVTDKVAQKAVDIHRKLPPVTEYTTAAKAGEAMRGWYEKAAASLDALFQDDARPFLRLLAALSPRSQVRRNMVEALRVWKAWDNNGRPKDPAVIQRMLESPSVRREGLFGGMEFGAVGGMKTRFPNIVRALSGNESELSGRKVTAFHANLSGDADQVTNDTWMAQFGDIDQKEFATDAGYLAYTAKVREAAEAMGWTPAEVQETVWSFFKRVADSVRKNLDAETVIRKMTHESMAETPAFHSLLEDADVRRELSAAGLPDDRLAAAKAAGREAGPQEQLNGPVVSRWTPALQAIAERADKYARHGQAGDSAQGDLSFLPEAKEEPEFLPSVLKRNPKLPDEVTPLNDEREGRVRGQETRARFRMQALVDAVKTDTGKDYTALSPAQVQSLDTQLKGGPNAGLGPNVDKALAAMRGHVDTLSAATIASGVLGPKAAASVGANLGQYLNRSYRVFDDPTWTERIPKPVRDAAVTFIEGQLRAQGKPIALAETYLDELLQDMKAGGVDKWFHSGKLGAKNISILKARKNIAPEIRAVMGEYSNPLTNYAKSVSKMATLISNHLFLEDVKAAGTGSWLYTDDTAPAGFRTQIAADGSDVMAPLNGMRTSPEIAKAFAEFNRANPMPAWAKAWMKLNLVAKSTKTVFSAMTQARNLVGQPFFWAMSGHWNWGHTKQAIRTAWADYTGRGGAGMEAYVSELQRLGILGDGIHSQELLRDMKDAGLMDGDTDAKPAGRAAALARSFLDPFQRLYAAADHIGKVVAFENELAGIKKIDPLLPPHEAKKQAAERVLNTYPTYSRLPAALQTTLRRQPFTAPFVSFWYEALRTTGNGLIYTAQDLKSKNPEQRKRGARRLVGQMMVAGAPIAASAISRALSGMGDDEEKDFRSFLPEWTKDNTFIYWGGDKKQVEYTDLSALNPYNVIIDTIHAAVTGDNVVDSLTTAAKSFLRPVTNEAIFTKAAVEVATNKKETGSRIYNPEDDQISQWKDGLTHLLKALEPGTLQRARTRIVPSFTTGETSYGEKLDPAKEVSSEFGVKTRTMKYDAALQFEARKYEEAGRDIVGLFLRTLRPGTPKAEITEAYEAMEERRRSRFDKLHQQTKAMERAGYTKPEVYAALTKGGVGEQQAKGVILGRYQPYDVSGEPVKQAYKERNGDFPLAELIAAFRKSREKGSVQ